MPDKKSKITLLKDKQWAKLDSELFKITDFIPMLGSKVKNGVVMSVDKTTPYASISIEFSRVNKDVELTGFITHKLDFANLWSAFKDREINDDTEEVLAYWTKRHYSNKAATLLSRVMPKLLIMVCPKGMYESIAGPFDWHTDNEGMAMVYALESINWWKPELMK